LSKLQVETIGYDQTTVDWKIKGQRSFLEAELPAEVGWPYGSAHMGLKKKFLKK
jgi:hypothetical protein